MLNLVPELQEATHAQNTSPITTIYPSYLLQLVCGVRNEQHFVLKTSPNCK